MTRFPDSTSVFYPFYRIDDSWSRFCFNIMSESTRIICFALLSLQYISTCFFRLTCSPLPQLIPPTSNNYRPPLSLSPQYYRCIFIFIFRFTHLFSHHQLTRKFVRKSCISGGAFRFCPMSFQCEPPKSKNVCSLEIISDKRKIRKIEEERQEKIIMWWQEGLVCILSFLISCVNLLERRRRTSAENRFDFWLLTKFWA